MSNHLFPDIEQAIYIYDLVSKNFREDEQSNLH